MVDVQIILMIRFDTVGLSVCKCVRLGDMCVGWVRDGAPYQYRKPREPLSWSMFGVVLLI